MKNVPVFVPVVWPRVIELSFLQFHGLANKPAAQPVPDHQNALAQKIVRVVDAAFNSRDQARTVTEDFKLHGHHRFEQPREPEGLLIYLFQRLATDHQRTHGGERSGAGTAWPHAHKLIAGALPDYLHQLAELITAHPCHFNAKKIWRDPGLLEQSTAVQAQAFGA